MCWLGGASIPRRQHQLRIIAGEYRGRLLTFADTKGLRPTPDRVRETLFNWLAPHIMGARCLDLYAGSGALGLEALSRGAQSVDLVERDGSAVRCLRNTIDQLAENHATVHQAVALSWLRDEHNAHLRAEGYDIVFVDPPYLSSDHAEVCYQLMLDRWLRADALLYLETSAQVEQVILAPEFDLSKQVSSGEVCAQLYRYSERPDAT